MQSKKYAFKCHRVQKDGADFVYPVNALAFHPRYGSFVSGGADGLVCLWDHKSRKRLKQYPKFQGAIQALDINPQGSLLAIACSGDSEVGLGEVQDSSKRGIYLRTLSPEEGRCKS